MLALCLLLTMSATLTSCIHKCEFSTEWSKDEASHWHACTGENCQEIIDKADHTWDEGSITTKATQEADGVRTFTCTVCAQTKTEAVAFTGLSEEDWNAAFKSAVFENFAYKEVSNTTHSGVSVNSESEYKFTEDEAWVKITIAGESNEAYAPDTASAIQLRSQLIASIKDLTPYKSYEYDPTTKTYKATKPIEIASYEASTSDITLTFADGKLVEIKYSISLTQDNMNFTVNSTVTLSDYGTVVLTPSAQTGGGNPSFTGHIPM